MTKHSLMLSAATAALLAAPAFAAGPTTISTTVFTAQSTSVTGDLTITSTGAVQVNAATTPVVTMDSSNTVTIQGALANQGKDGAVGVFINATTHPVPLPASISFINSGTFLLTGGGVDKIGVQVAGFGGIYTGDVNLTAGSNIQITGDGGIGVINDLGVDMKGNLNLGGTITYSVSDPNSTTAALGYLVKQWGTLEGNLVIAQGANFNAIGQGNFGVAILGNILPCDTGIAACDPTQSKGLFFNGGNVNVVGTFLPSPSRLNPESAYALGIGANVADGVFNSGPITATNSTAPASFFGNGIGAFPTVVIDPVLLTGPRAVQIGVYTTDQINPGFSFYNRGFITAQPTDVNFSTTAMAIAGTDATMRTSLTPTTAQLTANPSLAGKGGIFNSGQISASATSANTATAADVSAVALSLEAYSVVPRITVSGETVSTTNPTLGQIVATITGSKGGVAKAITIAANAQMPELNVVKGGKILATALTSDSSITNLGAFAVQDLSDTLRSINTAGTIGASITTLNSGSQIGRAIDLSLSAGNNIVINNSGSILGDVYMGQAGNNHRLFVGNVGTVGTNTTTGFGSGLGAANSATGVTNAPTGTGTVNGPALVVGTIDFGIGGTSSAPNILHVGGSATVLGKIFSRGAGVLDVRVDGNGTLIVANTQETLRTRDLNINGGELDLSVSQGTLTTVPIITSTGTATIGVGSNIGLSFGGFISSSTPNSPTQQTFTLIDAIGVNPIAVLPSQIAAFNATLSTKIPFLFQATTTPLTLASANHQLLLTLTPKAPGAGAAATNLNLSGSALTLFPYTNAALVNDAQLGSALINGVTSQSTAQAAYAQFAPDVSGGVREVAIDLTDQATGQVAARQRTLRQFGDQSGDLTLWGNEFAQSFNLKGVSGGSLTSYKDRGFGFVLGMDGGSKQNGWYGAALTFYTGDVAGVAPLTSKTNTQWYMFTGYTDWKGRHLFLDTQVSVGYGNLLGRRFVTLGGITRTAEGKRRALLGALGATMGATMKYAGFSFVPHISLDGMTMREEKYTETGGGNGLNLDVGSYYATSLRTFVGTDFFRDINLGSFSLRPEVRFGYRFDFLNNPVKLETQFVSTGVPFTLTGPNSGRGAALAGFSLGASSETWSLGLNYDWLRGEHGSTTQVGTISLLGRI